MQFIKKNRANGKLAVILREIFEKKTRLEIDLGKWIFFYLKKNFISRGKELVTGGIFHCKKMTDMIFDFFKILMTLLEY